LKTLKLTAILILSVLFLFTGCEKEKVVTVTNTVHDTLIVAPTPLSRTQLLTQKEWLVDEVQRSVAGANSAYVRGGTNTTGVAYGNIKIRFNADGTGTYTDEASVAHTLNWVFTTPDQRNATLTVGAPNAAVFNWRMIELKDNYLHNTTSLSNSVYAARYVQAP
jgi:hypothetical protein